MSNWSFCAVRIVERADGRINVHFLNKGDSRELDQDIPSLWITIHDADEVLVHIIRSLIPQRGESFKIHNPGNVFNNTWHIIEA